MPAFEPMQAKLKCPKKDTKGDLPDNVDDWIKYVNKCHDDQLQIRKKHEFQWVVNISYYKGYQNLLFDPRTGALLQAKDMTQPLIINRIGSFIESRHAKLTKNRPVPRTLPNTSDREDQRGARYMDQALMHLWRKVEMEDVYDTTVIQMLLCGVSFVDTEWDPTIGDFMEDYVKEEHTAEDGSKGHRLVYNEDGTPQTEKIFLGEVESVPLSAFAILPGNELIPKICDQPYLIKRVRQPVSYLESIYPHLRGKIKREDSMDNKTEYERIAEKLTSPIFAGYTGQERQKKDFLDGTALVKTFMLKPNYQYEKGLFITVIGKELAHIDVFPNDYGENVYPIVKFQEKNDGFSFWPQSTIERLIPIQNGINTLKQKKLKNAVLMANGKWLLAKGSQVSEESITDEEGEVIEFNPAVNEPKQAIIAPLPEYVSVLGNELIVDFRDAGGQRESSFNPAPNLTAGVAMQMQAELADEIINPIIRRLGSSMEKVANIQSILINDEWIEPRKIKVIGQRGAMAVQWLSKEDFKHHTDVHIEIESLFPDFRGAKQQRMLDFWDRRIITDPQDFLEAYRSGNFDKFMDKQEDIQDQIYLQIEQIKKGKEPEFNPAVSPVPFLKALTEWMGTPEFLRLIPQRKQMAIAVAQKYMQNVMASMPGGGAPQGQQNQAAVGSPQGPITPQGMPGQGQG